VTIARPYLHVYLMVLHDGSVYWDHGATLQQLHEANFVVVSRDVGFTIPSELVVWKDRFGEPRRVVNAKWAGIRAAQHLGWIDLLQRGDPRQLKFAEELCKEGFP